MNNQRVNQPANRGRGRGRRQAAMPPLPPLPVAAAAPAAPALPEGLRNKDFDPARLRVVVPRGADEAVVDRYVDRFGHLANFFDDKHGHVNEHADLRLRRNLHAAMIATPDLVRRFPTITGNVLYVGSGIGQMSCTQACHHVGLSAPIMPQDDKRIALLGTRGFEHLRHIDAWDGDLRAVTYCDHRIQDCDCGERRNWRYTVVGHDVLEHLPPADVARLFARPGCLGLMFLGCIYDGRQQGVEVQDDGTITVRVPGAGSFVGYDYRGIADGGVFDFGPAKVVVSVYDNTGDGGGVLVMRVTTTTNGVTVKRLGQTASVTGDYGPSFRVTVNAGMARITFTSGGAPASVVVPEVALRMAQRMQVPASGVTARNARAVLAGALATLGYPQPDSVVSVLYAYGVTCAASPTVVAADAVSDAVGVDLLGADHRAHLDAEAGDAAFWAAVGRLTSTVQTVGDAARGHEVHGWTTAAAAAAIATATVSVVGPPRTRVVSGIAAAGAAYAFVRRANAAWWRDVKHVFTSATARRLGAIALAVLRPRTAALTLSEYWGGVFGRALQGEPRLDAIPARLFGRDVSTLTSACYVMYGAPVLEECVKRLHWLLPAAISLLEGFQRSEGPAAIASRYAFHQFTALLPLWAGIIVHVANNMYAIMFEAGYRDRTKSVRGYAVAAAAVVAAIWALYRRLRRRALVEPELVFGRVELALQPGRPNELAGLCWNLFGPPANTMRANQARVRVVARAGTCAAQHCSTLYGWVPGNIALRPLLCAHNAHHTLMARVLKDRRHDDVAGEVTFFVSFLTSRAGVAWRRAAERSAKSGQLATRDEWYAHLATTAQRTADDRAIEASVLTTAGTGFKLQVKDELVQIERPTGWRVAGVDKAIKAPRCICAPPDASKSVVNYEIWAAYKALHARFAAYAVTAASEAVYVKYVGSAQQCGLMLESACSEALAFVANPPYGDVIAVRADIKGCDASTGIGAAAFQLYCAHKLGVIDLRLMPLDVDSELDRALLAYMLVDERPSTPWPDGAAARTRTLYRYVNFNLKYERRVGGLTEVVSAHVNGNMASGRGDTSDGTTAMVGAIVSVALATLRARGIVCNAPVPLVCGDDNTAFLTAPATPLAIEQIREVYEHTFAAAGFEIDIGVTVVGGCGEAPPMCSHIALYDKHSRAVPARLFGRAVRVLNVPTRIARPHHLAHLHTLAVGLLYDSAHHPVVRTFAERVEALTRDAGDYVVHDKFEEWRIHSEVDMRTLWDADSDLANLALLDVHLARAGALVSASERFASFAQYMSTWQLCTPIDHSLALALSECDLA
jgi:hypothetical protein